MKDCLFCKIIDKEIPSELIYEDDKVIAFKDINPRAPVHILIIPKKHISSAKDIKVEDEALIGRIFTVINKLGKEFNLENGYRIVNNCGNDGGQTVQHMHFHVLGGRELKWPPG